MGTPVGSLGGMALVHEVTYGVTPALPTWVWQHPAGASYGNRRGIITPTLLSYAAHTNKQYNGIFADGDLMLGFDLTDAVIGEALGLVGASVGGIYKLGDGSIPDANSASVLLNYGGGGATPINNHEWIGPGMKPNAVRLEIVKESNAVLTLVGIGQPLVKTVLGSSETPAPPAESDVVMPADIGTVTVGVGETWETVVCLQTASMEALVPKTGFDRRCINGVMREPITSARPGTTFNLALDLDDTTGNDTIGLLESFNAGEILGDISIGTDILIKGAIMGGDFPPLTEGLIDFSINGQADYIQITTV